MKYIKTLFSIITISLISQYIYASDALPDGLEAYNKGDYKNALRILEPIAVNGGPNLQFTIGLMYIKGRGTAKNPKQAISWWTKSANRGHVESMNALGMLYHEGDDVKQDNELAKKWYQKAADLDDPIARYMLNKMQNE